jgi:2-polyprenyl-3-methyl-5-hydroxy-6-metoxy-1,4-benzoquinol methylase
VARTIDIRCNLCGTRLSDRDRVWRKDGHDIVRCRDCDLLFSADPPTATALVSIYGPAYFTASEGELQGQGYLDYLAEEPEHRRNARSRLRLLQRFTEPGRLLDVGCAAGFFLDEARRVGWAVCGVDVSEAMTRSARARLLPVRTSSFLDVELGDEAFDVVTMWDYIEHVLDPRAEIRHAARVLRPSGIFALSTGDAGSAIARISGKRWHLLTPRHHNFFFTRGTLMRYLEEQGFQLLTMKKPSSTYSVAYLAHKSQTVAGNRVPKQLLTIAERSPLGRLKIPLNLFDIMTLVARKIG